jgi:hypothetical protein
MDYVILKDPGTGAQTKLQEALNLVGPNIILNLSGGRQDLGEALEGQKKRSGLKPITVVLDITGFGDEAQWFGALDAVLKARMLGGSMLPLDSSVIIQTGISKEEFDSIEDFKTKVEVIDLKLPKLGLEQFPSTSGDFKTHQDEMSKKIGEVASEIREAHRVAEIAHQQLSESDHPRKGIKSEDFSINRIV